MKPIIAEPKPWSGRTCLTCGCFLRKKHGPPKYCLNCGIPSENKKPDIDQPKGEWKVVEDDDGIEIHLMCGDVKLLSLPNYDVRPLLEQIVRDHNRDDALSPDVRHIINYAKAKAMLDGCSCDKSPMGVDSKWIKCPSCMIRPVIEKVMPDENMKTLSADLKPNNMGGMQ